MPSHGNCDGLGAVRRAELLEEGEDVRLDAGLAEVRWIAAAISIRLSLESCAHKSYRRHVCMVQ